MTPLRQRFLDDLRLRNYSPRTLEAYVSAVARFARHFGRSPELLGPEEIRSYQLHLIQQEHASWSRFNQAVCALRWRYRNLCLGQWDWDRDSGIMDDQHDVSWCSQRWARESDHGSPLGPLARDSHHQRGGSTVGR